MTERLFTKDELEWLALSGAERVRRTLARGDAPRAREEFVKVIGLYRQFHDLYHGWTSSLFAHLNATYGHEFTKASTHLEYTLARHAEIGMKLDGVRVFMEAPEEHFAARLAAEDSAGAFEYYLEVERGARDLHDFYRDYVSYIMSNVYKAHGVHALEQCLRASSERDWMPWMMQDIEAGPRERLVIWAELLGVANFGSLTLEEHDDRFVMIQNPCGSCGRQHRGGRYDDPWGLAVVTEKHPITYGQGGVTTYRTHIPVMHYLMPLERIGAPWPLIQCPRSKSGQCRITLFKDSRQGIPSRDACWSD